MATRDFEHLDIERRRRRRLKGRLWREWCFLRVVLRHFSIRALIMLTALVGGAILFLIYGKTDVTTFGKALYYTWSLVLGEPPTAFPDSAVLDVMFFIMPIIGLTVIIEGIIDFALMVRDRKRYERSWCEMMADSLKDHIVLVGFGRLGYSTYLLLRKLAEPVVVIERDPANQFLEELRRDGVPLFIGDARREALLHDANVEAAKSIIVATDDDLANLEIALDARRITPGIRVIMRLFDQNMADKIGEGFNIKMAMSQSAVSAPAFAVPAAEASIVHSFIVGDDLVVLQRWIVREGGPLHGRSIAEVMRDHGVTVVKRRRGMESPNLFPSPDTVLDANDSLLVQGPYDVLRRLKEHTPVA